MTNPFLIEGPAVVSFSGGRTSGYMLRRILDEGLQPDVHVLFANTGKERPETLDFVHEVETRWDVPVRWLEFALLGDGYATRWREVTYATAARNGEPFEALIGIRKCLPNPAIRYCTSELKLKPMHAFMRTAGYEAWENVVGIRADEPRRVARMRDSNKVRNYRWENSLPLAEAGVTVEDVNAFWRSAAFDLQLRSHEGNCDLCFLKHINKRRQIIRDRPDLAVWWVKQETDKVDAFRREEPSYAHLLAQMDLFADGLSDENLIECYCTD